MHGPCVPQVVLCSERPTIAAAAATGAGAEAYAKLSQLALTQFDMSARPSFRTRAARMAGGFSREMKRLGVRARSGGSAAPGRVDWVLCGCGCCCVCVVCVSELVLVCMCVTDRS
jgi:hypothetical protein